MSALQFTTSEKAAAFEDVKGFVRENVPQSVIDRVAFPLAFENDDVKRQGISAALDEVRAKGALFSAATTAFIDLVRERIDLIESSGRGCA